MGRTTGCPAKNKKVKNLLAMLETWVQSLGQEDPLEEEIATHSSILAWRIPWTEEPGGLRSRGSQRVVHDKGTITHFLTSQTLLPLEVAMEPCFGQRKVHLGDFQGHFLELRRQTKQA